MGPTALVLLFCAVNGGLLACLVGASGGHRAANRFLAALVALISLRLLIYVLGFAGAYDAHPWLTFLPLDLSLAFGPLLWLYVETLTRGAPPSGWRRHLWPAAAQLAYYSAAFLLPSAPKARWYSGTHLMLIEPVALALILASASAYLRLAWRRRRGYQLWLDDRFGSRETWRMGWLRTLIAAFAATLAVTVAAALWSALVAPIDYFGRTPVMFVFSGLAYILGLIGWRQGATVYPAEGAGGDAPEAPARAGTDYAALFAAWRAKVEAGGWWRAEQVTLADIARCLAVSERTLSRGLRDGGGCNFNVFINRLRVEAVQRALAADDPRDLLTLALDSGFNSKASFNRAFRAETGRSPSSWRAAARISPIRHPAGI